VTSWQQVGMHFSRSLGRQIHKERWESWAV